MIQRDGKPLNFGIGDGCELGEHIEFIPENKFAYLAVFDNANWVPVCWARTDDNTALFENLNKDILYMPGYYNEEGFMPAALPFILDDSGNIRRVKPNPERTQTLVLSRKYQNGLVDGNCKEMLGGRFQAANRPDFSDAFDLAEIKEKPESAH